jgi:hypothetical protein
MGNNQVFTIFEHTVIGAYNLGKLDKPLLKVLMEPYEGTDIDHGGCLGLTTKDGLLVEEVVLKVWGIKGVPKRPKKPSGKYKVNSPKWKEWDEYQETIYEMFSDLTRIIGWS